MNTESAVANVLAFCAFVILAVTPVLVIMQTSTGPAPQATVEQL